MSDPGFRADAVEANGEVILTLAGEIDMLSAPNFASAAIGLGGNGKRVVFDLAAVTFMDSAGLSVLAGTLRRLDRIGGSLCLRNVPPQIRQILKISALDQLLTIEESVSSPSAASQANNSAGR
jgi:anti-sigma B factor antagonist